MSKLELFACNKCGGNLKFESADKYRCTCCGSLFTQKEGDFESTLKITLGEEKYEKVSAARQNLWSVMHEEYVNSSSCMEYARELKLLVPSDYYANFAEAANGKGEGEISRFLNKSSKGDMETYADAVLDFMIKSMTPGNLTAVCNYIDRAYPKASPEYAKYINLYEEEAEKVESGIYELTMPRDVFVAYSSKDIDKVLELTDYLEEQGISCFISMRNLRHGRGAADNYDKALQTAIDNCKTVVFISSRNSRSLACDALRKEIPYIRKADIDNVPAEYKAVAYEKIPYRYKKDRVEYLLDDYANTAADKIVKQFFDGVEWCKTSEDVADRVITYLTAVPEDDAPRGGNIGDEDIRKIVSAVSGVEKSAATANTNLEVSISVKEKNIIGQVERLISTGDFEEALERINDLEKEEQNTLGICSASIYYYKLLIDNKVDGEDRLVEKLFASDTVLADNRNFRMAKSCADSPDKERILQIEKKVVEKKEDRRKRIEDELGGLSFYRLPSNGYSITGFEGKISELPIPKKHDGVDVTEIGDNAFKGCTSLTSVTIPDNVNRVGSFAFSSCINLKNVVISKNATIIGESAFSNCAHLTKIEIPDSVVSIGAGAFDCSALTNVTLGNNLRCIDSELFRDCDSLKYVVIPDSVTEIKDSAFANCSALIGVVIPRRIRNIQFSTFAGCKSFKYIFYRGNIREWRKINMVGAKYIAYVASSFMDATVYFYCEYKPNSSGKYWHYDEDGVPVIW